jgi:lipopolysaccharide export system permease protein
LVKGGGALGGMKLIERYIFRRMILAMVLSFIALASMLWLSQALREFNLVTEQGQALSTFLQLSAYLFPVLIMIVLPLSVLIGVAFAMTTLNGDSELAVINASGMRQWSLLKPALLIGTLATVLIAAMTFYFTPLSLRLGQTLLTQVRSSLVSSIAREGAFTSLADGLTFHLQSRQPDGTLRGIFVADDRDPMKSMTYIAEKGAIIDNPLGTFLVMSNGSIQQRSKVDDSISIIEFTSYAFDLSTFASAGSVPAFTPRQQPTQYLLNPNPNDPYYRQSPGSFAAELHDRITSPLYGFVFALFPLLFLSQAQSTRMSRAPNVAMAAILLIFLRAFAFFLTYAAAESRVVVGIMYALPIGLVGLSIFLVLRGIQVRPPDRLLTFFEGVLGRISGLFRRRTADVAPGNV